MAVIGLDLGGTKLAAAVFTSTGEILAEDKRLLFGREGAAAGRLVIEQVDEMLARARVMNQSVDAIGLSVPGIYRTKTGTVWAPNIPDWDDYPLLDEVQAHVGEDVTVTIDSDRTCCILGEQWLGAAQNCRHAIFLAVGTGIGAGIMTDGRVLRGAHDIAGAVGWLALSRPYEPAYDACGDFEYHASGAGLVRVARGCLAEDTEYAGPLRQVEADHLTAKDVFRAFDQDDPLARRVLKQAVAYWGRATANLVSLLNPEVIIFGGGIFGPASALLDDIRQEACRWAQPISIGHVTLAASEMGGRAALYGTGRLAFDALSS